MSRCILLLGLPFGVSACGYLGSARDFDSGTLDPTWVAVRGVRFVPQEEEADCGGAALAMVLEHAGVLSTPQEIMNACGNPAQGLRARDVRELARGKGLAAWLVEGTFEDLEHELSKGRP